MALGRDNQAKSSNAIFGDFQVVNYGEIDKPFPMIDFFLDHWRGKGGESKSISRADINPLELKKYLEHIVLLDLINDDNGWRLIVRLIGGHVADFYGEITGKDVREMDNSKAIERIYYVCGMVQDRKEPVMTISPAFSVDKEYMEALALYLPLFDKNGTVNKILVAVHVSTPARQ